MSQPSPARDRSAPGARRPERSPDPDLAVRYGLRVAAGYAWRLLVIAVAVYVVFVVLGRLQLVAVAVFVGLVVCALLRPLVDLLGRGLPRSLSVALSLLLGLAVVAGVFSFIGHSVAGQSTTLAADLTRGVGDIERWLRGGPLHLSSADLTRYNQEIQSWLLAHRGAFLGTVLGGAGTALEILTGLALALFSSIFFLHSGDRMWAWVAGQVDARHRVVLDRAAGAGWSTFAGYTRGIVVVAAANGLFVCLALLLLRVPLALPLGLLVFFATFIPLIGAPIAMAVATIVALAARGPLIAIAVVVLTILIFQLEGHVLQPMVMSRAVNLHPVVVAISVAAGTVLAGVVGAVVAVPMVAVGWSMLTVLRNGSPTAEDQISR